MSIQENTLVFRRSLLHLVVIGSIIHQSISFLSRGHSTPLCPALPCVTLLREALAYFYLQRSASIQPKTSEILPKICQQLATTLRPSRTGRSRWSGSSGGPGAESGAGLGLLYAGILPYKARARFFARPVWAEMTRSPPRCKHVCLNWDFVLRCIYSNFGGIPSFSVFRPHSPKRPVFPLGVTKILMNTRKCINSPQ